MVTVAHLCISDWEWRWEGVLTTEPKIYSASVRIQRNDKMPWNGQSWCMREIGARLDFQLSERIAVLPSTFLKEALDDNPVSRPPPWGKYPSHSLLEWESFRQNHPVDLFEIITWGIVVLTLRANEGLKKSSRDEVEHELGKWRRLYKWLRVTATSCEIWGNSLNFSNYKNKLHILIHVMAMLGYTLWFFTIKTRIDFILPTSK